MSKTTQDTPVEEQRPPRGRSRRKPKEEAPTASAEATAADSSGQPASEDERPATKAPARRRSTASKGAGSKGAASKGAASKSSASNGAAPKGAEASPEPAAPAAPTSAPEEPATAAKRPRAGGNARVVVVGPDGRPMVMPAVAATAPSAAAPAATAQGEATQATAEEQRTTAGLVDQPTKVIRIGSMIKQLLEEVRTAPLDEAARVRLTEVHARAVRELEDGLSGDLLAELRRLTLPLGDEGMVPSDAELRIAQAQLVGWLEGLFQSIQTALVAQQMASQSQRKALPPGLVAMAQHPQGADQGQQPSPDTRPGQYL